MRCIALLALFMTSCQAEAEPPAPPSEREAAKALVTGSPPFASQTDAPAPDYVRLNAQPRLKGEEYVQRDRGIMPAFDPDEGQRWVDRLDAAKANLGYGRAGKGPDGPINFIDVGMTESEFDSWAARNGWTVPSHITFTFQPAMNLPPVSDRARDGIRLWPASSARTGAQLEALLSGRVELRDGCFWTGDDELAFFHAEIGLDRDAEGYFILVDRVSGQTRARVGEDMVWGGPPSAYIGPQAEKELRAACGEASIVVVGSPESEARFLTQHPHLRNPAPPPSPPPATTP